jgi:hypothetical protein
MEQQQTGGSGTGEPSLTEEVQAQPEADDVSGTETPALNRADRRAQAKGKKTGAGANSSLNTGGARGSGKPTSGHAGQVRFPRTGHK